MVTRRGFTAFFALAIALPAAAQEPAPTPPPGDDSQIVVFGDVAVGELPTQTQGTLGVGSESRQLGADSAFFVRCASLPRRPQDLRDIVDHGPRDTVAEKALHRFVIHHLGCFQGIAPFLPPAPSPYYGQCNEQAHGTCRNTFDRGALYERALAVYAVDYRLTRFQTFDKAARARFLARQQARNHLRLAKDMDYFTTVACFVQISPQYGQALLRAAPGTDAETTARQYLIGYGSPCVGGAKTVKADASQFRAYAAEAVYEWIVAAKGVATLVG